MPSLLKFITASILLAAQTTAFVPVTSGPSLNQQQGKIAGIGGIDGPKPPTSGGIGSFKVGSKSKAAPVKKEAPKKAAPKNNIFAKKEAPKKVVGKANAAAAEPKKKVDLWIKTPWSK
jgi:hypothetical protein